MNHFKRLTALALTTAFALAAPAVHAGPVSLFSESFEGGLAQWAVREEDGAKDAAIVVDPRNANNHVLNFSRTYDGNSATSVAKVRSAGNFTLSFDYLGMARPRSVAGDLGGTIGIVKQDEDSGMAWLGGTGSASTFIDLVDDGLWHSYSLTFASTVGKTVQLVLKDDRGARGVAGDAYFDNIVLRDAAVTPTAVAGSLNAVPEPSSLALTGTALLAVFAVLARRRRDA
jgi:hypothetical protein